MVALGDDATVLVPIGAIEQHGPHLPLSVDWIIADAVAQAVVDR
ncbi:MAG: creatinine amidohydrolase, partial [Thermoproteota archaeon]